MCIRDRFTAACINASSSFTDTLAPVTLPSYKQQYPVDSDQPVFTKDIDASALWKKIVHNAWKSAEPGVLSLIHI